MLEVSRLRNVVLQVLPFEQAFSDASRGPMVLVEGPDHERFAFMEGAFAGELSTEPGVVSRVTERLSMIRTSSPGYSDSEGGARVEVARSGAVHVRDSKAAPSGPELRIATPAWAAVVSAVRPEA
ncbi:Scr1 family TA system antitoxin-like transcriptional regulator [Streptomyces albogriseolus]|uniref:DUF397 domain-containing protein n=1 Tax=Streptomyces albogriseolus TaxID=1887 RepID=UPI00345F92BD